MPQLQTNNPGRTGGLLGALLDLAVPNAAASTQNQADTLNKQTAQQKPQLDPYQEGVKKALKQAGETHAMEAIQQGVPAQHIVDQSGLSPKQNDPAQILAGLISAHLSGQQPEQQQQSVSNTTQPTISQAQSTMSPMQQQAGNLVQPATSVLGKLFESAGFGNVTKARQLENISKAQEIQGQKPFQVGDYQKAIVDNAYKMQQARILQPDQLMTKFEQASQPFITLRDSYARIQSLANDPSPAGDLGLIFSYMKVLDPNSTVREGEQATAANAAAVPDRISNLYNNVMSGGKLTPNQRKDFINKAGSLFKSAEMQQKKTTAEFSRLGKMNGINPSAFIRDTGLSQDASGNKNQGNVQQVGRFQVRVKG